LLYHTFTKIILFFLVTLVFFGCASRPYVYKGHNYYTPSRVIVSRSSISTGGIKNSANMHRATMRPYTVLGKRYYPTKVSQGDVFSGIASWYGSNFHNKKTSNGEYYNMYDMTAAHKTLPMNTMVKVTNLDNGRQAVVRINDRGPFVNSRIIDLSNAAARKIDMVRKGTAPVRLEVIGFNGIIGKKDSIQSVVISKYLVQIGAFRNRSGAYRYANRFKNINGRYNSIVKAGTINGEMLYRVYLRGFGGEVEARDFVLSGKFIGSFIVSE